MRYRTVVLLLLLCAAVRAVSLFIFARLREAGRREAMAKDVEAQASQNEAIYGLVYTSDSVFVPEFEKALASADDVGREAKTRVEFDVARELTVQLQDAVLCRRDALLAHKMGDCDMRGKAIYARGMLLAEHVRRGN